MKRNVRGIVARVRADVRFAGVERYRAAVAENAPDVRMYLALAAGLDRIAGLGRAAKGVATAREDMVDSVIAVGRRLRQPDTLLAQQVAVAGTGEISISLTGPAAVCAAARGLALHSPSGTTTVALPTEHWAEGEAVRLVAATSADHFPPEGRRWLLAVTDGNQALPVVTPARDVITQRWPAKASWPPRLDLDADRRLSITGRAPVRAGVDHAVQLGLTSVVLSWAGDRAELRVTSRNDRAGFLVTGHAVDGECRVTLDLLELIGRPAAVWDLAAPVGPRWRPLQLAPGGYPPMGPVGAVRLVGPAGPVAVQLAYSARNRLVVRVGTAS
jgi:predicted RNA-binding protein with EMAP domain